MHTRSRRLVVSMLALVVACGVASAGASEDGLVPPLLTTTTTASDEPPPSTSTTAPSERDGGAPGGQEKSTPAPDGAGTGNDGDGTSPPPGGIVVPPEAQRIIDSVVRSAPSNSQDLWDSLAQLQDVGLTPEEAQKVGLGRFIIAGPARYTHDWLYPRYGPGFRFHLGTDVFAAYGTPVRAPVDGTVQTSTSELGGLSVKVYMDDGTYFYMAHLSGLPDGFAQGMEVETGDIVGYVGDSGNAKGTSPHVHFGVYPQGGAAVDPKPILDGFLDDARARLPELVEHYRQQRTAPGDADPTRAGRSMLSTELLRPLISRAAPPELISTDVLFASSANPTGGALRLVSDEVESVAASIDWDERARLEQVRIELMNRVSFALRQSLASFGGGADRADAEAAAPNG